MAARLLSSGAMPRSILLLAIVLVGACRPAADAEQIDAPSASVAGTEATTAEVAKQRSPVAIASGDSMLGNTLVAVTTVNASDAQPCERVCGSLGDCLLANTSYAAQVAGGLELECLDMCVHSPDTEQAKIDFLACGSKTECGQLEACAERTWTALSEVRKSPEIAGIVASTDPCKLGCRWYFSCFYGFGPPGQAYLDPQLERDMNSCIDGCDNNPNVDRTVMGRFAECLPSHCTAERAHECWDFVHNGGSAHKP